MHENDKKYLELLKRYRAGELPTRSVLRRVIICEGLSVTDAMAFIEAEDGGPGSGNFGHSGRPGLRGGSGKGGGKSYRTGSKESGYTGLRQSGGVRMSEPQAKTVKNVSNKIRNLKNEQTFIIGRDGEIKVHGKGGAHEVATTVGEKREHLPGNISLHNHPKGGPFSLDDLNDFGYGATEIRVSGPDGDYCLRNLKYNTPERYNGWYDMEQAMIQEGVNKEVSSLDLMKKADAKLKGNETRQKIDEIGAKWVEMKKNGATQKQLTDYYNNSGYAELAEKAKKRARV